MVKEGGRYFISKRKARLIEFLPEKIVIKIARRTIDGYLNKYAKINVNGYENIKKANGQNYLFEESLK